MFSVANRRTVIILIQCAPENYFETAHHNQGQKTLPQGFFIRVKRKQGLFFSFLLYKRHGGEVGQKIILQKVRTKLRRRKTIFGGRCVLYQGQKKSSQQNFPLIFRDSMLCILSSTTTQTTFGIQQRLLVLEILEIVSCGNLTRAIAALTTSS